MTQLVTLRKEDIPCLRDLLDKRAAESNLTERWSVETYMQFLMSGYDSKIIGAYADDLLDPKICLLMMHAPDIATTASVAIILLVYVDPSIRGNPTVFSDLVTYAENYARLVGAKQLVASAWKYRGSKSIASLWERYGFEEQEIKYIKLL